MKQVHTAIDETLRFLKREHSRLKEGTSKVFTGESSEHLQKGYNGEDLKPMGLDRTEGGCYIIWLSGAREDNVELQRGLEAHLWDVHGIKAHVTTQ